MIERLSPHIVHQIAAGEVVERPGSALKELIENALDAAASRISILIEDGGLSRIAVEDDGIGINRDELPLAFEAHATSKLRNIDDLQRLSTYGFRGEALSSISSVADVEIWTSPQGSDIGWKARVSFGEVHEVVPADKRSGTQVVVRNLFEKHPARLKFMKSVAAESRHLQTIWRKYAAAHPEIAWTIHAAQDGSPKILPVQTERERVLWFFDAVENDSQWFDVEESDGLWKVQIFSCRPRYFGEARSGIHIFLNKRPIRDSKLEFAVKRGFESFTDQPRLISALVFIEGPPHQFDVNVHPMKLEARFLQADPLFSLVVRGLRRILEKEHRGNANPSVEIPSAASAELERRIPERFLSLVPERRASDLSFTETSAKTSTVALFDSQPSVFEYLGSIDNTYLIVRKGTEGLVIFDQHALHERILYERCLREFSSGKKIDSQRLLFPIPFSFEGSHLLLESEEVLDRLGFEIRIWNDGKMQMLAAPAFVRRGHSEILQKLSESIELPLETMAKEMIATMACHGAVRAHDVLNKAEIERLLKDFQAEDALGHCPHGRPTFVQFALKDLEKMFHRLL